MLDRHEHGNYDRGRAVDTPIHDDGLLRDRLAALHDCLAHQGDELLLAGNSVAGNSVADVATMAGFYDQAHLHRHFVRYLGVTPGRYARTSVNLT